MAFFMSADRKPVVLKGKPRNGLQFSELLLDSRNVQILALLSGDPRMSVSELARRVGMSGPATRERIQRMEDAGIIRGCHLDIDPAALGYPIAAFIRVRP